MTYWTCLLYTSQNFYQDEKKATRHLSQQLKEVEAENSQLYAMKRDFRRVWNYFGAEKMQQVIGLMRGQEQTADRSQKKNRQNSVEPVSYTHLRCSRA